MYRTQKLPQKLTLAVRDKTMFICKQLCGYIILGVTNNPESFRLLKVFEKTDYGPRYFLLA